MRLPLVDIRKLIEQAVGIDDDTPRDDRGIATRDKDIDLHTYAMASLAYSPNMPNIWSVRIYDHWITCHEYKDGFYRFFYDPPDKE